MATPGFYFSQLCATGKKKSTASIKFGKGLTVISGASDTGKSYLVQCLDFMTGGSDLPEQIEEAAGYETLWLEIKSWNNSSFTLERSLKGGDFRLYRCNLANVDDHEAELLKAKHKSSKTTKSVSEFLLELCSLDQVELIAKKKDGTKWSLSFRPVAHLSIVSEEQIYTRRSPVHASGIVTQRTFEESLFRYFITGVDDSSVIAENRKAENQSDQKARDGMLREIIDATEQDLAQLTDAPEEIANQLRKIEKTLEDTLSAVAIDRVKLRDSQIQRNELRQSLESTNDRNEVLTRLVDRFRLLEKYYTSDLNRLEAMSETGKYLAQLPKVSCPICGTDNPWGTDDDLELLGLACSREVDRIQLFRSDLSQTMADIREEMKELQKRNRKDSQQYDRINKMISDQLIPAEELRQSELRELLETQRRLERASALINQIDKLKDQFLNLEESDENNGVALSNESNENATRTSETAGFCKVVETVLNEWKFPDMGRVAFSERNQDLVIKGKDRSSHGKGIRALSHAAFTVALLRYCRKEMRPHPGFVVLDSPLVAYREPDSKRVVEAAGVKESFYLALAKKQKNQQIIVFENEDPPAAVKKTGDYIHFSGDKTGDGRCGFFPVA